MKTNLTLSIKQELIERAKRYAAASGKSVSQIVADYFAILDSEAAVDEASLPPITRALSGILEGIDEKDYYDYLEEKYL